MSENSNNINDFFDLVFEKMEDANAFNMEDKELMRHRKENIITSDRLYRFIKERVHPKSRKELFNLLENRNSTTSNYYFRENQLYYKNGFLQGLSVAMDMFNNMKKSN